MRRSGSKQDMIRSRCCEQIENSLRARRGRHLCRYERRLAIEFLSDKMELYSETHCNKNERGNSGPRKLQCRSAASCAALRGRNVFSNTDNAWRSSRRGANTLEKFVAYIFRHFLLLDTHCKQPQVR